MRKLYISCLLLSGLAGSISAQNIEQAKQLFLKGEYSEAKPLFQSLLKKAPSNANYNYWFGACEYETGNPEKAIPYLKKGAARKVTNAYKYLGLAYYDLYQFEEAQTSYEDYIQALTKSKQPIEEAEKEMEGIKRAARMIKGVEKVTVIDSFTVDKKSFLNAYKISKEAGNIEMNADNNGTSYTTENGNKMIFSQPDSNGNMQLYSRIKLINEWSEPEAIKSLNADANVSYPFLMPDGITLYYSTDSKESLGGYDIFVTRYDSEEGKYLKPDNLGMPYNSPYNDYMYAVDEINNLGWFASDRFQPEDKVCVYVFVPNETKEVYDYESTDAQLIKQVALLTPLSVTQHNKEKVNKAKQQLQKLLTSTEYVRKSGDFEFIIDDTHVYNELSDFRSADARKAYQQMIQKQKDYNALSTQLESKRDEYINASAAKKSSLAPSILDLEKRTEQLQKEIEEMIVKVRNLEISKQKR